MNAAETSLLITSVCTGLATLISSIGALAIGLRNSRKIEQVHRATNSMHDEIVNEVRRSATAEGVQQERARSA